VELNLASRFRATTEPAMKIFILTGAAGLLSRLMEPILGLGHTGPGIQSQSRPGLTAEKIFILKVSEGVCKGGI
jgi:hypothetical protein